MDPIDEVKRLRAELAEARGLLNDFKFRAAITPLTATATTAYHYWGPDPSKVIDFLARTEGK